MIKIYNTISREKEEFVPQDQNNVKMYVCGITPYDDCHIGHARCYVVFDVIRRYIESSGYKVNYIQNFTDIDDKIINKAKDSQQGNKLTSQQVKEKTREIAEKNIESYFKQMELLNVKKADSYPRVTEHMSEIVEIVKALIEKGFAYEVDGDVYFEVTKFKEYGKLSHRSVEEMIPQARVETDEKKRSPLDFALWKKAKENEPSWDSPWGKGRPGWHIECSVMSMKHLDTQTLDIHGGGQDLVFPHHENEIAQSEAYSGKPFAKYWVHNGFITINKEKMSKSLGNFFSIREVLEKYDAMFLRFFLLSAHYRQPIDYSDTELDASKEGFQRLKSLVDKMNFIFVKIKQPNALKITNQALLALKEKFVEAMDDDFNTQKALGYVFELVSDTNTIINKVLHGKGQDEQTLASLKEAEMLFREFLGVLGLKIEAKISGKEFDDIVVKREDARKNKDWALADTIRKELEAKGFSIEDTALGSMLIKK